MNGTVTRGNNSSRMAGRIDGLNFSVKDIGSNPARTEAESHHGSLKAPIILRKDDNRPYKVIENQHVFIIRNGEKYDVTGKKL